jgi:hypothetical protein
MSRRLLQRELGWILKVPFISRKEWWAWFTTNTRGGTPRARARSAVIHLILSWALLDPPALTRCHSISVRRDDAAHQT